MNGIDRSTTKCVVVLDPTDKISTETLVKHVSSYCICKPFILWAAPVRYCASMPTERNVKRTISQQAHTKHLQSGKNKWQTRQIHKAIHAIYG